MNLDVEHNLLPDELRKALHGIAEAEGISEDLAKSLRRSAVDLTPKVPQQAAVRHLYELLQAEFRQADQDIEMYAEHLFSLRKSQLSFDFHHVAYDRVDPRSGKLEHIEAKDHSVSTALHVVEETPQEAAMKKDVFYDKMTRTWICRIVDAEGNQVGDCDYEPNKELAQKTADRMLQERTPAVKTDLKEQLEAHKPHLKDQFISYHSSTLERFKLAFGPQMDQLYNGNKLSKSPSYPLWVTTRSICSRDENGEWQIDQHKADAAGQEYADSTIDAWQHKITYKVKDLQNTTVHHLEGNKFLITGERDGKNIRIEQDMIINRSVNGTLFNQFPARIYVDGKFISETAYKKLTGDDAIEKEAKAKKDAEKRAKNMLPSGKFAKGDKVRLKLVRQNGEKYETTGTVESEKDGKTMVRYGSNRFNMHGIRIETDKLERWQQ